MTTRRPAAIVLVGLMVGLCQPAAAADSDDTRARELFRRAEMHFNVGEFEQARQLYTSAYKLRPLPGFLFNIAQCHHFSRQHERALFFYRSYLARLPDAHNRAEVERLIATTEAELARLRRERATTIKPEPHAPSPVQPAAVDAREPPTRAWLVAGASASAALLVTGAVTGGLSIARSREYKDPATAPDRRPDLRSSGLALAATSAATLAVGALLGAGTIIYWRVSYAPRARAAAAARSAAVVPLAEGGAALVLGGRF